LILTVRTNGGGIGNPSSPPSDLEAYKQALGQILDKYSPEVLAVENEENSKIFYTGTPEEYAVELKAACEVAHSKGIKCTNGGLVSAEVALLVWDWMMAQRGADVACSFARRALEKQYSDELCQAGSVERLSARARQVLEKGHTLMQVYRSAGMDYMNFHWYISDPEALGEAVAFLKATTGLPVMTNEIGQQNEDPAFIQPLLQKAVDLGLPYIVWYSVDAPKARSLYNSDGSLRPAGQQFQAYIQQRYK
ncbi:MAG: hypothetical protein HY784_00030, partial [Chloroflexi bacterium]|nr:hypothetical protein [Chloroflexota bacterium]